MSLETNSFEFGGFLLDTKEKVLLHDGKPLQITPKAFQLLQILVENHGHLVEREELLNKVWGDSFVEEGNLTVTIRHLRKVLGDEKQSPRFIETVPKRGYRFVAEVRQIENNGKKTNILELIESKPFSKSIEKISETEVHPSGVVVALAEWRHEKIDELIEPETENRAVPKLELVQPLPPVKAKRSYFLIGLAAALILLTIGSGLYFFIYRSNSANTFRMNMMRLTSNGKTKTAAVSPDGKFVAYVLDDEGQQSIRLKNVATGSDVQILPSAEETDLSDLTFSPNGNYIYYNAKGMLTQLPILGGLPKIVLANFGPSRQLNSISFAPDGKQFAFIRRSSEGEETSSLVIADVDGTNERVLASSKRPELFLGSAVWSPDGKAVACVTSTNSGTNKIVAIQVADGTVSPIPSPVWSIVSQIVWQPNGKELFVIATQGRSSIFHQIWSLSYPNGEAQNISNDFNNYQGISLTADGRGLVAVRREQTAYIWATADENVSQIKQLTRGIDSYDGIFGLNFLADGRIIYETTPNGKGEVWMMDADGGNRNQIVDESGSTCASPNGKYVVFQSKDEQGTGLFRLNLSNGEKKRLTTGADVWSTFSPDGNWVVFTRWAEQVALWKVSIEGGEAVKLTDISDYPLGPAISPDGKLIAFYWGKRTRKHPPELVIIPFEGGKPIKSFPLPFQYFPGFGKNALQWTPDGKAVIYALFQNDVSNLWQQPLDNSPPVQVTNFTDQRIFNFSYLPDGKQLALSRGTYNRDVILINNQE